MWFGNERCYWFEPFMFQFPTTTCRGDRKTLSGKFGLSLFPQPNFHEIESLFGRILGNQPAVNAAKDVISFALATRFGPAKLSAVLVRES